MFFASLSPAHSFTHPFSPISSSSIHVFFCCAFDWAHWKWVSARAYNGIVEICVASSCIVVIIILCIWPKTFSVDSANGRWRRQRRWRRRCRWCENLVLQQTQENAFANNIDVIYILACWQIYKHTIHSLSHILNCKWARFYVHIRMFLLLDEESFVSLNSFSFSVIVRVCDVRCAISVR